MNKDRPSAESESGGPEPAAGADPLAGARPEDGARPQPSRAAGHFLQGRLLIAAPAIGDPRFDHTVLLVCVHDQHQAMALVLNRPMPGLNAPSLLRRLGIAGDAPDAPVLYGGPVERERGYVVHTDDYRASHSTLSVAPGLALTDTREVLDALGDDQRRPRRYLLALGYAGWGAGQLESEIRQGAWLTCEADEALVFGRDYDELWASAMAKIGVRPERLSTQAGRA
jgi:putative transcriptional regulator